MSDRRFSDDEIASMISSGFSMRQMAPSSGAGACARVKRIAQERGLIIAREANVRRSVEELATDRALREYYAVHGRKHYRIDDGVIVFFTDPHFWPDLVTPAHLALLRFCKELRPRAVFCLGDAFDGATVSKHARIGWQHRPSVERELEACKDRMGEVEDAAGTRNLYWLLGNHDARYETFIAQRTPELEGVHGLRLKHHFPVWIPAWSVWINEDVVAKHRFKGGVHAARNNTLHAGKTTFTGHLHALQAVPHTDYNGTRWGVDCGTTSTPYGPQFVDYTEDNPVNWRSGFVVATWRRGKLMPPECVFVDGNEVKWRGTVMEV